jgi:hypothetical protein
MVGQIDDRLRVVSTRPIGVACLGSGQYTSRKGEGGSGEDRWSRRYEFLVEESDLGDVQSHVLNLSIVRSFREGDLEERIDGGVTDDPVEDLQNVPLHLSEHLIAVHLAAHGLQLPNGRDTVLLVTVLGGNEQGYAANELVMALSDNTAGAVAVEKVDSEEPRSRAGQDACTTGSLAGCRLS